jgi:hypothetical protein
MPTSEQASTDGNAAVDDRDFDRLMVPVAFIPREGLLDNRRLHAANISDADFLLLLRNHHGEFLLDFSPAGNHHRHLLLDRPKLGDPNRVSLGHLSVVRNANGLGDLL